MYTYAITVYIYTMIPMNNDTYILSEPNQFNSECIRSAISHENKLADTMYGLNTFVPPGAQWNGNFNVIEGVCNRKRGRA